MSRVRRKLSTLQCSDERERLLIDVLLSFVLLSLLFASGRLPLPALLLVLVSIIVWSFYIYRRIVSLKKKTNLSPDASRR